MFFYVRCLAAGFLNNKVTTTNNVKPLDGVNLFCIFKENLSVNSFLANYKNTTVMGKIRFFAKGMAVIVLFGFLLGGGSFPVQCMY